MQSFRVVLHYKMPSRQFKVFYNLLKKSDTKVDGIYKARHGSHEYYQDYSQILLDFSIPSYEALGKRVLFVASFDICYEAPLDLTLIDESLHNPDIASLCKKLPIIFAVSRLSKKYSTQFDSSHISHYEPITLLVPSIQSQKKNAAFSMPSLVKVITTLASEKAAPNFLEGSRTVSNLKEFEGMFHCIETGVFWQAFHKQKVLKKMQAQHLERLKKDLQAGPPKKKEESASSKDPTTTMAYMQLLELNSNQSESIGRNIKFDASFSDDEFDSEVQAINSSSRISTFVIPSLGFFENSPLECIKTEPCPFYQKRLLSYYKR